MTTISEPLSKWVGKTIDSIRTDKAPENGFHMVGLIHVKFTDGSVLVLRTDWRGDNCYISQVQS